jgi:hypothetical protein
MKGWFVFYFCVLGPEAPALRTAVPVLDPKSERTGSGSERFSKMQHEKLRLRDSRN